MGFELEWWCELARDEGFLGGGFVWSSVSFCRKMWASGVKERGKKKGQLVVALWLSNSD